MTTDPTGHLHTLTGHRAIAGELVRVTLGRPGPARPELEYRPPVPRPLPETTRLRGLIARLGVHVPRTEAFRKITGGLL